MSMDSQIEVSAASDTGETLKLRYAFSISLFFEGRIRIEPAYGGERTHRSYVAPIGGELFGPRLQGKVLPLAGADYGQSLGFDAHYMLQAQDGALIYIRNRGLMRRFDLDTGEPLAPTAPNPDHPIRRTMRVAPTFDAPVGPHDWLNRAIFVGHGHRHTNPDHSIFTYYEVL
jgi:hypothetical protein